MSDSAMSTESPTEPEPSDSLKAFGEAHNAFPKRAGNGPIQLLETPENEWFAYLEGQESSQFIVNPKTISVLHMRCAKLRSQALTPEDSRSLLERMRGA